MPPQVSSTGSASGGAVAGGSPAKGRSRIAQPRSAATLSGRHRRAHAAFRSRPASGAWSSVPLRQCWRGPEAAPRGDHGLAPLRPHFLTPTATSPLALPALGQVTPAPTLRPAPSLRLVFLD